MIDLTHTEVAFLRGFLKGIEGWNTLYNKLLDEELLLEGRPLHRDSTTKGAFHND